MGVEAQASPDIFLKLAEVAGENILTGALQAKRAGQMSNILDIIEASMAKSIACLLFTKSAVPCAFAERRWA